jgi:hypothetical protein
VYSSKCQALKMHLAYELNRMIPVQFISTAANDSERNALIASNSRPLEKSLSINVL